MISLTYFFDGASQRHNDAILLPAIRKVSDDDFVPAGQCNGTPRRARATVELLRQETPNFLAPNLWPPNSPDLVIHRNETLAIWRPQVGRKKVGIS